MCFDHTQSWLLKVTLETLNILQMPTNADKCRQMPTDADKCRQMLTNADKCRQMPTNADKLQNADKK